MANVTRILAAIEQGDPEQPRNCSRWSTASCADWPPRKWHRNGLGKHSKPRLSYTEAYIRLVDVDNVQHWDSRGISSPRPPRRCGGSLVENARRKLRDKHGGQFHRVDLSGVDPTAAARDDQLLLLDERPSSGWKACTTKRLDS